MTEEKKNKIKKELKKELDERNELLSKARDFHFEKLITANRDYANYITKLGEISFIVGAAITPIVIISQEEIRYPKFIFLAIFLYLLNGILALWKSKDIIERQLDAFAPGNFHEVEKKIYPLQFLANKIIFGLKNDDIKEYIKKKKEFLTNNVEEKISNSINIFLDIVVFIFVLASVLIVRSVWTFSHTAYWYFFGVSLIVIIALIIAGALRAKSTSKKNAQNTKELNEMKLEYADWWKKNIGGDNE